MPQPMIFDYNNNNIVKHSRFNDSLKREK